MEVSHRFMPLLYNACVGGGVSLHLRKMGFRKAYSDFLVLNC